MFLKVILSVIYFTLQIKFTHIVVHINIQIITRVGIFFFNNVQCLVINNALHKLLWLHKHPGIN